MQNSKIPFALLFLGLAVISYQFIMHPTVKEQNFAKHFMVGHGDLAADESDSTFTSTHKKVIHTQVAGLAPTVQPTPVAEAPVATPAPTAAPVDLKNLAKATDAKAKKDDKDKKKKKKKKTVSATPDVNAQNLNVAPAPAATPAQDIIAAGAMPQPQAISTNTNNTNTTQTNAAKNNAMVQYYESLLLTNPDLTETQKFVSAYKSKQINDDVFFTVTAAMMADSRLQMKDLAVYAYGQVINIKSFEALVTVTDTDTANDVVRTDALKYLTSYSDVTVANSTVVLSQALGAALTTPSLHIEALKLLDTATKQYAQLELSAPTSGSGQITTYAYTATNAQKLFLPILTVLNNLLRSATDSTTKTVASQDLSDIQSLVGSESASINP